MLPPPITNLQILNTQIHARHARRSYANYSIFEIQISSKSQKKLKNGINYSEYINSSNYLTCINNLSLILLSSVSIHIYSIRSLRSCTCVCWYRSYRCISWNVRTCSTSRSGRWTCFPDFSKSFVRARPSQLCCVKSHKSSPATMSPDPKSL